MTRDTVETDSPDSFATSEIDANFDVSHNPTPSLLCETHKDIALRQVRSFYIIN